MTAMGRGFASRWRRFPPRCISTIVGALASSRTAARSGRLCHHRIRMVDERPRCPVPCVALNAPNSTDRTDLSLPGGSHDARSVREARHAQEPDVRLRADPVRLAGLVLLHRAWRRAGAGGARDVDRADPATPVHVSGGLSLQMAAADRQPSAGRGLCRHLRLFLRLFPFRIRAHRDLCARAPSRSRISSSGC